MALLLVLAVAAIVRLVSCRGYVVMDESAILFNIAHFVRHHTFLPSNFSYPTLFSYLATLPTAVTGWVLHRMGMAPTPADFIGMFAFDSVLPLVGARLTSVAFGVATLAVVYATGRTFFTPAVGLLAAAVLALSQFHIGYSALALPDATAAFFAAACVYGALAALQRGGVWFPLAGAAAGLAATSKYNAVMIAPAIVAAYLLRLNARPPVPPASMRPVRTVVWTACAAAVAFLAGSPGWLVIPRTFWDQQVLLSRHMAAGHFGMFGTPYLLQAQSLWLGEGTTALVFGAGLVHALWQPRRARWVLVAAIVPAFLALSAWQVKSVHYLLFLFPALAILGAEAVCEALRRARREVITATVVAVLAWPAWLTGRSVAMNLREDNRWAATRWIESAVPSGTKILADWSYVPRLVDGDERDRFERLRRGDLAAHHPGALRTYDLVRLEPRIAWLLGHDEGEFLVTSASCYERFLAGTIPPVGNPLREPFIQERDFYRTLLVNPDRLGLKPVVDFGAGPGPRVLVFARAPADSAARP